MSGNTRRMPALFLVVFLAGGALSQSSKWIMWFLLLGILHALQQTMKRLGGSILFNAEKHAEVDLTNRVQQLAWKVKEENLWPSQDELVETLSLIILPMETNQRITNWLFRYFARRGVPVNYISVVRFKPTSLLVKPGQFRSRSWVRLSNREKRRQSKITRNSSGLKCFRFDSCHNILTNTWIEAIFKHVLSTKHTHSHTCKRAKKLETFLCHKSHGLMH